MRNRISWSLALIVASSCASLAGCDGKKIETTAGAATANSPAASPLRVTVVTPTRKTLSRKTDQPGQVEPFEETAVVSKLSGYIKRIYVEMGDRVQGPVYDSDGKLKEEGQVLAELTVPELEEELRQKEALVAQADAEVLQSQAGVKVGEAAVQSANAVLQETEAGKKHAEAIYDRWESEFKRLTELAAQSAVTAKVVDETRSQMKAADAARDEARAKNASAQAGVAESMAKLSKAKADQTAAEAKVKVAAADFKRVEALMGYSKIRAPFDGVVSGRNVHTGYLVQSATGVAGKTLFTVTRTDKVRIFIDVPESDARFAEPQRDAVIHIPAAGNKTLSGDKIASTAWVLDPVNRTLKVEIDVANESGELRPGMYVTATLPLIVHKDVLALPAAAIAGDSGKNFCWTVVSGKLARKEIVVGLRAGPEVEIVSGLKGDEAVVSAVSPSLMVGQSVEIPPAAPPKP